MKKEENSSNLILIIAIIIVVIIFIASLGQVNITQTNIIHEKEKDLSKLKHKHNRLKTLIKKKEEVNKKLNRRFKWIYFGVRFGLFLIYGSYNLALYFSNHIDTLEDFLNWNELALIIISIFSFLTFGTFANVSKFINDIKMKLEIRIYNKHANLLEEIEKHLVETNILEASITVQEIELNEENKIIKPEITKE